jgi:hypothetical protein
LLVHHTSGRERGAEGVAGVLRQRGLSVQYVIDRDGNITQIGRLDRANWHAGNLEKFGGKLGNQNLFGVEVIAKNEKDVTDVQRAAIAKLDARLGAQYGFDPKTNVYGHGEGTRRKEALEGHTAQLIREGKIPLPDANADRATVDSKSAHTTKVEGSGTLTANINAPRGTDVTLEGGGLFKKTQMNRQIQMSEARDGPPASAAVAGHGTAL